MSKPARELDFHALAAFMSHHSPGIGDPMSMPIDSMMAHATAISNLIVRQLEAQTPTTPSARRMG